MTINVPEVCAQNRPADQLAFEPTADRHYLCLALASVDQQPTRELRRDPNHPLHGRRTHGRRRSTP